MNKKGFTVVELTVSFSLVSIIAIMLFNLIFSLKELYVSGDIKTSLLNKQAIMDKKIYEDLNSRNLSSITACGVSCLTFTYADGDSANLLIDVGANTITYDNYTMKLNNGTSIEQVSFDTYSYQSTNPKDNAVFHIDIPIKTTLLDDDFGIHIVKTYNTSDVAINKYLPFNDPKTKIIANGVELELALINDGEDWTNVTLNDDNVAEFETEYTDKKVIFAHIFHQEQGTYFDEYNSFLKSKDENKLSSLKSLEVFRSTDRLDVITNVLKEAKSSDKDKKRISDEFAKGYFELILDYPGYKGGGRFANYNRWIQTSNFTNSKNVEEGNTLGTGHNGNSTWQNGLRYVNSDKNYVTGSKNDQLFAIGMKKDAVTDTGYPILDPTDPNNSTSSVDVWIRANDYINKYALATLTF